MRKILIKRIEELEKELKPQRDPYAIPPAVQEIIDMMLAHRDKLEAKDDSDKKEN